MRGELVPMARKAAGVATVPWQDNRRHQRRFNVRCDAYLARLVPPSLDRVSLRLAIIPNISLLAVPSVIKHRLVADGATAPRSGLPLFR